MINGINHVTWNVENVEEAFRFYVNVLGLKPIMKSRESAYFMAGSTWLAVVKGDRREDTGYDHTAFDLDRSDYDKTVEILRKREVVQWKKNESEGDSFYFLDPSGNRLELHCSSLESRIEYGKENWEGDVEWYI